MEKKNGSHKSNKVECKITSSARPLFGVSILTKCRRGCCWGTDSLKQKVEERRNRQGEREARLWSGSESIGSIYSSRRLSTHVQSAAAEAELQTGIFTVDITPTNKLIPSFFIKNNQSYRRSSTAAAGDALGALCRHEEKVSGTQPAYRGRRRHLAPTKNTIHPPLWVKPEQLLPVASPPRAEATFPQTSPAL